MLIGVVMCLSNLYVVLKTGWSVGVTITSCIVAFAFFNVMRSLKLVRSEFSSLENNAMGSVASAAGYMTGGGNMAALPALFVLTGTIPDTGWLIFWFAVIAALGVFAAIPIKRQLINVEQLPFPTGTATAQTIRALHGHGDEAKRQASRLGVAAAIGAAFALLRGLHVLKHAYGLPFAIRGFGALSWTWALEASVMMLGVGGIISFRTAWSMMLGSLVMFGVIVPELWDAGILTGPKGPSFRPILQWTLWSGAGIMVASGLTSFAFEWRSVGKAFSALGRLFQKKDAAASSDPMEDIECPAWWFPAGFVLLGPLVVFLCAHLFGIPWWAGLVSLPLSVLMGIIASRVTGETDVTPTKALGPVTQLTYGGLLPGNVAANVMSANVTGGVGLHAADLLTDLKSGFLLGAKPRQQFYAQLFGVVAGAAVVVPAFRLLVPTPDVIGSSQFPAPAAQVWAGVSKVLVEGANALHPSARWAALFCMGLGVVLALAEKLAPKKVRPYVPSPSGLGIAFMVPAYNVISFFLGAVVSEVMRRKRPKDAEGWVLPVSSGFIAGESVMGIAIAILVAVGVLSS
jgi:OPT family oligopeptide transporter